MNEELMMGADVSDLTALYRNGDATPLQATEIALDIADTSGRELNAVSVLNRDAALTEAAASTERWANGKERSDLDGIPVSVKDSFSMAGLKRWHGSRLNDTASISRQDGAPVRRLREAGAILFTKTAMPDFGLIGAGPSSQFGIARNPWNPRMNPGGSSSGSGILLALGAGPLSIGTDMAGSVRLPAALCGVVGLKPTQGRIAYDPPKLIGSAGPMGRCVADVAALLKTIGRPDDADHLSLPGAFEWNPDFRPRLDGAQVGVLSRASLPEGTQEIDAEVQETLETQVEVLKAHGAAVESLQSPLMSNEDLDILMTVLLIRGLPELLAAPEDLWEAIPVPLLDKLLAQREWGAAEYIGLERALEEVRQRVSGVLNGFDFTLSPTLPIASFPAEAITPSGLYCFDHMAFTAPFNLTSLPAGTVPCGMTSSGLPIGIQVGGRRFEDGAVLSVLALLEEERPFSIQYPFLEE